MRWRRVDFGNLGAEELGSVYESLLELIPRYDAEQRAYTLETLAGNERKESGSYYTPTSLVDCLLDSALDPLLDEACSSRDHGRNGRGAAGAHGLRSGLRVRALPRRRRPADRQARRRRGDRRVRATRHRDPAPRCADVVGRCIYGVDINPMAVELAKVSLWLEALEPGKPLSFLDQNIRVGNSLLGVTPALLAEGLPDAAFTPIEGDDRKVASALKKQNAGEREGQHDLFSQAGIPVTNAVLAKRAGEIAQALPDSLEDLHIQQQRQAQELAGSSETPSAETAGRRLVRGLRPAEDGGHPVHRDHARGPGTVRRGRWDAGLGGGRGVDRRPRPPVPVLPLARGVPAHLPRRQRRHRHRPRDRLGRRLLLRHRQPSVGAHRLRRR